MLVPQHQYCGPGASQRQYQGRHRTVGSRAHALPAHSRDDRGDPYFTHLSYLS